ncbi:MAG TPA: aminopeptidase [Solirubrobacteraceae bacterium]|jgi:leucyl aminopeptidase (aminopeptidase T)
MTDLQPAVQTVVEQCLAVQPREEVVVVVDPGTREIGEALRAAAAGAGAEAVLVVMEAREADGNEPPAAVAGALAAAQVFIAPTSKSLSHTRARKAATENGARGATLPGVTADMLARLMACDFAAVQRRSRGLARLLTDASEAHLTCPLGSDFRLDLSGREGIADDGDLTGGDRAFGNLPCGEGFIAPLGGEGRIFVRSLAGIGLVAGEPAELVVEGGRLAQARGPEGEQLLAALRGAGEQGTNLAELGIGTNERATLTGNILEDEKMLGTVHVAFGASAGIGGTVSVPIHLDTLVTDATLDIGGTRVLDAGTLVFEG